MRVEKTAEDRVEDARVEFENHLYTMIDAGLGKRDAYRIVQRIEQLIDAKIEAALERMKGQKDHTS